MDISQLTDDETRLNMLLSVQPVYARNQDVKAFILHIEQHQGNSEPDSRAIYAINRLIVETYTSIYQQGEMQTLPCILNVSDDLLQDESFPKLPPKQYILEVDALLPIDDGIVERLHTLAASGYRLALSGFDPDNPALEPLLKIVHIVRLDLGNLDTGALQNLLTHLKPYSLELMADKLANPEQFRQCLELGFQYFAGNLFGKPEPVEHKPAGANSLLLLELLGKLADPEMSLDDLEKLIMRDANLTYRFLKVANAAGYGISREIETLSHALSILGTRQIQRWLALFLMESHDDKPGELAREMLTRGRMCEILASNMSRPNPISYFIVGLLSRLDVLTDMPMEDLMSQVLLSQEIKDALLHRRGIMGTVLTEVEEYTQGCFDHLYSLSDRSFYEVAYRHSVSWAKQVLASNTDH